MANRVSSRADERSPIAERPFHSLVDYSIASPEPKPAPAENPDAVEAPEAIAAKHLPGIAIADSGHDTDIAFRIRLTVRYTHQKVFAKPDGPQESLP